VREKRLCSKLDGGVCEGRFRIWSWYSDVKIIVRDEAGNEVVYLVGL